ncbi:MAG: Ig-like domain-containing protein [Lachnospiraceae bacterium]|nr:Ig-like domain-containing protein [Lachnospiraceae bacterium]
MEKTLRKVRGCILLLAMGGLLIAWQLQTIQAEAAYQQKLTLLLGETRTVSLGKNVSNKRYQWSSNNKNCVTVNKNGKITGKKKGIAVVTAKRGKKQFKIKVTINNQVDLIIFAGQSNMSGGGNAALAPTVIPGAGYEYRSVTAPNSLKAITEPFGKKENSGNLNDQNYKQGSLVSSFVNAYYRKTKVPVVAVSATRIGSSTFFWKDTLVKEAEERYKKANSYLKKRKLKIRHRYVVWYQGEAEGIYKVPGGVYSDNMKEIEKYFHQNCKIEKFFVIRIGKYFGTEFQSDTSANLYDEIIRMQTKLCLTDDNFVLVSVKAASFQREDYNPEGLHLNQKALNRLGTDAGKNTAYYVKNKKQPSMYDGYLNMRIPVN